ncbi:MAG: toprim domain-containing protein [Methanobrevibacter sp.]|jgi:hypothetical protein|nr:toprim domain-containing protein [Candidatus Methanoflexus mossambicus]
MIKGNLTLNYNDLLKKVSELEIIYYYLNINKFPILINSPFRDDKNPSFRISFYNNKIVYKDFGTNEIGSLIDLLKKHFNITYDKLLQKINKDIDNIKNTNVIVTISDSFNCNTLSKNIKNSDIKIDCIKRNWEKHDNEYWKNYNIDLKLLNKCNVFPISFYTIKKNNNKYFYKANKYAYAFYEYKDNIKSVKIYQPFVTKRKWINNHNKSVISLWTLLPKKSSSLFICSSLKDALCLYSNTNFPCISLQGEGYNINKNVINELKNRFDNIYILFDNDEAGIKYSKSLATKTNFINIILPNFKKGKDVSDMYVALKNKENFNKIINKIILWAKKS